MHVDASKYIPDTPPNTKNPTAEPPNPIYNPYEPEKVLKTP